MSDEYERLKEKNRKTQLFFKNLSGSGHQGSSGQDEGSRRILGVKNESKKPLDHSQASDEPATISSHNSAIEPKEVRGSNASDIYFAQFMTREAALEAKKTWGNAKRIIGHQRRNDKLEFKVALPRTMKLWMPTRIVRWIYPELLETYFDSLTTVSRKTMIKKDWYLFF